MTLLEFVNLKLAILTVASQLFIVASVIYFFFLRKKYPFFGKFFNRYGLLFAFVVSLAAMLVSLFYSEIAGYEPCTLCWYQRIIMYPQVVLLGIAAFKRDWGMTLYGLVLSSIGVLIAGFHYLMQIGLISEMPCSAVGYSVSCVKLFVM